MIVFFSIAFSPPDSVDGLRTIEGHLLARGLTDFDGFGRCRGVLFASCSSGLDADATLIRLYPGRAVLRNGYLLSAHRVSLRRGSEGKASDWSHTMRSLNATTGCGPRVSRWLPDIS